MKALVIGYGVSGKSARFFLEKRGYLVSYADSKESIEGAIKDHQEIEPFDFDLVILSPGISQGHILCQQALRNKIEVIGESELAFRWIKNRVIAITGTNGKTTLTLLVTHVLNSIGLKARSLGNIGVAITSELDALDKEEIVVAELSSYQLETIRSVAFDAAVITNLTPDHLDRYKTMENYAKAKLQIFHSLKPHGSIYIHEEIKPYIGDLQNVRFFGKDLKIHPWMDANILYLVERLNSMLTLPTGLENILAGFLLTRDFGVKVDEYLHALSTFIRPKHRLETIAIIDEIEFCNDSKATNVASLEFALATVKKPTFLIMGGKSKGSSYLPLLAKMEGKVKQILTIGEAAEEIEKTFEHLIPCLRVNSLENAVKMAYKQAEKGDLVLLSPACSSFDQFKNYEDRGDQFRKLVEDLASE
ncbi:MAG: UDP-N-acetylmuramoyl-L-alanine--D-glutamate ligase [Chlamydiae bacterium]|nr:UDP-N-acetylmuramoyl-L-alanine--D-glutamate ligase [Chlamydiota bacterium]